MRVPAPVVSHQFLGGLIPNRLGPILVAAMVLILGFAVTAPCLAEETTADADKAFERFSATPWYDDKSQTFKTPKFNADPDNPIRQTGWKGPNSNSSPWDWFSWLDWFSSSGTTGSAGNWSGIVSTLVYTFLTIIIVSLIGFLIWLAVREYLPNVADKKSRHREVTIDPARIDDLPFEAKVNMGDPLAAARMYMEAGNYDAATIYLYGYMLLAMDSERLIYLQKGKTNRMYLRELHSQDLTRIVEKSMRAFEDSFFGKHTISQQRFMTLWGQLDSFHQMLSAQTPAATSVLEPAI